MWYINRVSKVDPDFFATAVELLQSTSRNLILATGTTYLLWHIVATFTWSETFRESIWLITPLMAATFTLSWWLLPKKLLLSQAIWQTGLLMSITIAIFIYRQPKIVFFYVFLPLMAVVTVGRRGGLLTEGIIIILAIWLWRSQFVPLPFGYSLGVIIGGAFAGLVGWVVSHTLLTITHWAMFNFNEAQKHIKTANTHRGEVVRVLKSLDLAYNQIERTNQMLVAARNRAEEAGRLKQQFAQTISHELRTPLNLVVGFTELMTQSPEYYGRPLPPAYLRDLTVVYRNACHLQK